jgi:TatD DNase family protein
MIDTHCHLSKKDYKNLEEVTNKMGEGIIITSGIDRESNEEVLELCNKYPNVYGTLGIHPENINDITEEDFKFIEDNLNNPKIVGVGEIG